MSAKPQDATASAHAAADEAQAGGLSGALGALFSRASKRGGRGQRSPAFEHGVVARERGNDEAAYWLLREAFDELPDQAEVALAYWDVARTLARPAEAQAAAVMLVERHAANGDTALAAHSWLDMTAALPETRVSPTAIACILPSLRQRIRSAADGAHEELCALARRAMDHAVGADGRGLTTVVALRLFEEGRELHPDAARIAANVALASSSLHEAKRSRLEEWLAESQDDGPPKAAAIGTAPGDDAAGVGGPDPAGATGAPSADASARAPNVASSAAAPPASPSEGGTVATDARRVAATVPSADGAVGSQDHPTGGALSAEARERSEAPLAPRAQATPTGSPPGQASAEEDDALPALAPPAVRRMRGTGTFATPGSESDASPSPTAAAPAASLGSGSTPSQAALADAPSQPTVDRSDAPRSGPSATEPTTAPPVAATDPTIQDPVGAEGVRPADEPSASPADPGPAASRRGPLPPEAERRRKVEPVIQSARVALSESEISAAAARVCQMMPSAAFEEGSAEVSESQAEAAAGSSAVDGTNTPSGHALKVIQSVAAALEPEALIIRVPTGASARIAYTDIEAVATVSVSGIAESAVTVVDLVLNWSQRNDAPLRILRLRSDTSDIRALLGLPDGSCPQEALAQLLATLFERAHAIPLPDPESALGLRVTAFDGIEAYQSAVLRNAS